ncbi:helix-turn-helix domain-containing protein [Hansschlegelia quercus]|uniref:Helix-turn-helix domain-containing protein n=1 Tax=Hansschlegelia quercus TaxID=2528245 RepID=A0A4Q9GJM3_9HYPH|nr:helix-turn-helix domain-containing protein [Hansschlegelia quercus]TBN53275.1 helix-turn-helix domain-containing protein [Hansschlegelia quercus]
MDQIARTPGQIGAVVRRRRKALDLSQDALGEKISMRQATISNLEAGDRGAKLGTLLDAMSALGLELVIRPRTRGRSDEMDDLA